MTNSIQSFVHNLHSTISNEDSFLQDLRVIQKQSPQNYHQILKKCFLGTTCIVIYLACSNLQPHNSVLSATKGYTSIMGCLKLAANDCRFISSLKVEEILVSCMHHHTTHILSCGKHIITLLTLCAVRATSIPLFVHDSLSAPKKHFFKISRKFLRISRKSSKMILQYYMQSDVCHIFKSCNYALYWKG